MNNLIVYCSQPASGQMATFLMAVSQAHHLLVRPISALPAPDPLRRQALRTERAELVNDITVTEFLLEQYRCGQLQPDANHENGLQFDLQALKNRLRGVNTVLGTEIGGPDNG